MEQEKIALAKRIIKWHSTEGIVIRKSKEKRDCLGRVIDSRGLAYFDLVNYYASLNDLSEIEIDFLLYCQSRWLLEIGESEELIREASMHLVNDNISQDLIDRNHFLAKFSRKPYLPFYERKNFLEVNCCYNLIALRNGYYKRMFSIDEKKIIEPDSSGILSQLKPSHKLTFGGFFHFNKSDIEIPIFNVDLKGIPCGIGLYHTVNKKRALMNREDVETLNTFGNYKSEGVLNYI